MVRHEIKNLTDEKIQLRFAGHTEWFEPGEIKAFQSDDPEINMFLAIAHQVIPNHLKGKIEIYTTKEEEKPKKKGEEEE